MLPLSAVAKASNDDCFSANFMHLVSRINCNIFSYDYSGYGASSGKASEKNLYADIEGAWNALRTRYGERLRVTELLSRNV